MLKVHWIVIVAALTQTSCESDERSDAAPDADTANDADEVDADTGTGDEVETGPVCEGLGETRDGARCNCDEDCQEGAVCLPEEVYGYPGGECFRSCELEAADTCPGIAVCADVLVEGQTTEGLGMCLPWCADSSDCALGRSCSSGYCMALCQDDADCLSGSCDVLRGLCTSGTVLDGAGVMERCLRHEDCASEHCGNTGRCVSFCDLWRDGCPEGSRCVPNGLELVELGVCYPECGDDESCELDGLTCAYSGYPQSTTACLPSSGDSGCLGQTLSVPDDGPCGCNEDCGPLAVCLTEADSGWPFGRCHKFCDPLKVDDICAPGFVCERRLTSDTFCLKDCADHDECGPGYLCIAESSRCYYACESDEDCRDASCDLESGRCQPPSVDGLSIGSPCERASDCLSLACSVIGSYFQCTRYCRYSEQRCPEGSVCVAPDSLDVGHCAKECETSNDCGHTAASCVSSGSGLPDHCE